MASLFMPRRTAMSENQKGGWGKVALAASITLICLTVLLAYDAELGFAVAGAAFIGLLIRFIVLVRREL